MEKKDVYYPVIGSLNKRDAYYEVENFINSDMCYYGNILVVCGLRRTGKTVIMQQLMNEYHNKNKCAFYEVEDGDKINDIKKVLRHELENGTEIVCLDEITKADDFITRSSVLADVFAASGMKIVVTGTDSLGFFFASNKELFDRDVPVRTTHIPFAEHCRVLGTNDIDDYIQFGGLMCRGKDPGSVKDKLSSRKYVDNAVAENIANSISKNYLDSKLELLSLKKLRSTIEKVVEKYSGVFNVKLIKQEIDAVSVTYPLKNLDNPSFMRSLDVAFNKIEPSVLDRIDANEDNIVKDFAEIIKANEKMKEPITLEMVQELRTHLENMDVLSVTKCFNFNYDIKRNKWVRQDSEDVYIVQPAIKYYHLVEAQKFIMKQDYFSELEDPVKRYLNKKLQEKIFGDMTEQIVLFDTSKVLSKVVFRSRSDINVDELRYDVGKPYFRGNKNVGKQSGEYDMLVCDRFKGEYWGFEVKHTSVPYYIHEKHLLNEEFAYLINRSFGRRENVAVLYNGGSFVNADSGCNYLNLSDFMLSVDKHKDMHKVFDELTRDLPKVHINGVENVEEIKRLLKEAGVITNENSDCNGNDLKVGIFTGLSDDGIPTEFIPDAPFREKAERKKRLEEAKQNGKTGDKPIDSGDNSGPGGGR